MPDSGYSIQTFKISSKKVVLGCCHVFFDELVKSLKMLFSVIPANPGIQYLQVVSNYLDSGACPGHDPGFSGVTTFFETIFFEGSKTLFLFLPYALCPLPYAT
jgi:hypothetical protein